VYTPIAKDEYYADTVAQGARDYGYPLVVQKSIDSAKLAAGDYTVDTIISVGLRVVDTGRYYKFVVVVGNTDKTVFFRIGYTIFYDTESAEYHHTSWWF